jgi:hypothetical protein
MPHKREISTPRISFLAHSSLGAKASIQWIRSTKFPAPDFLTQKA